MSTDATPTVPQLPDVSSGPPLPPRRRQRGHWLVATTVLVLLVAAAAVLVGDQLRRSTETTTTAVDGEVRQLVVESTAGDLRVSVANGAAQVRVTENRPSWGRAESTSSLDDGVLHLTSECSSRLLRCSIDHHVELPAGVDVRVRAVAGAVHLVGVGDVDVELVSGNITIGDAIGASYVTRTEAGGIRIDTGHPPALIDATTTTGNVTVTVPAASYRVDASAVVGGVDVAVEKDAEAPRKLRARTVAGGISIQPAAALSESAPPPRPR